MRKIFFIALVLTSFHFGLPTFATTIDTSLPKRKLRMAYTDFPPFQEETPQGPRGIIVDQAKKIAEQAGYEVEMIHVPFKRMQSELASGNVDIWIGLTHYKEFKGNTLIGRKTVLSLELMTYSMNQEIMAKDLSELKKYRLITFYGYTYGGLADEIHDPKNHFNFIEVKDNDQALHLLKSRRADVFLNYRPVMETWLKDSPQPQLKSHLFKAFQAHIAVSQKTPDGPEILKNLEQVLPSPVANAP
ncbi:MAG TPA: transporter substrate-binding domain-containing protein [Bdellovibrio sp.]|uniref:substrate-binding periplasmic protein n=1 Tax=Bdellovibrio sp. TaxID=28201 RepID=UPI002F01BC6C